MDKKLTKDQKILIHQFVEAYHQLPEKHYREIKKEVKMTFVATTISEYYIHEGELKAEKKIKAVEKKLKSAGKRGELIGKIQLAQEVLKFQLTPKSELETKSLKDLEKILKELKPKLA